MSLRVFLKEGSDKASRAPSCFLFHASWESMRAPTTECILSLLPQVQCMERTGGEAGKPIPDTRL